MNAKKEFIEFCEGKRNVKCAYIHTDYRKVVLEVGYNDDDYKEFLSDLDFEYYDDFGEQKLHGTIWFEGGTWGKRCHQNGVEFWEYNCFPEIPDFVLYGNAK